MGREIGMNGVLIDGKKCKNCRFHDKGHCFYYEYKTNYMKITHGFINRCSLYEKKIPDYIKEWKKRLV